MANLNGPIDIAFERAIQDFRGKLKNEDLYRQILQTTSADQVYDLTDKLQEEQSRTGRLRHLNKIEPFLEGLRSYASVIEVFMQAKPDILALVWGPIKLLLQWASTLRQSMDAIVDTTANIGTLLPEFRKVSQLFGQNQIIKEVLVLFFKDILDFYAITLKFFTLPRLRLCFEGLWPIQRDRIKLVVTHIERHTMLLRNEVRLEHIQAEYDFRRQAFKHFEKTELSHQRQEYQSIRTSIAPHTYQEKLQRLDDESCHQAGMWLLKDPSFCSWIDNSNISMSVLWMQGIPGSGKTHLARLAVREAQKNGYSLFAFLTYTSSNNTSALSIIHSLIFQLTADDTDMQSIVCHSSGEKFRNSVEDATHVFRALLCSCGPVYITIDGLDEVEPVVRCRILKILLQLSSEIEKLGLLVCCRPEPDLADLLKDSSTIIRVDNLNVSGIQAYITQRKKELYHEREFFPEAQNEMDALLAPLATKSRGMFLYVKVVLESVWDLEFDEMKKDLSVLPTSLDAAYNRILTKINTLNPPAAREKARTIVGWIGVSPAPLTIYELEQALVVHAQSISDAGKVSSKLPLLRLCGPIVEIVDGYVQFVHFTVHEYFLSSLVRDAIDPHKSRQSLATCCVKYFCQHHHDLDIDLDTISQLVLDGAFRLHDFAASNWLKLTENVLRNSASGAFPCELLELLELLLDNRKNQKYVKTEEQGKMGSWKPLEKRNPNLYSLLCTSTTFQAMHFGFSLTVQSNEDWVNLDPLTISRTKRDAHAQLERLLSTQKSPNQNTHQILERHYGGRPFKCTYVDCAFRRHGFESRALRDSHAKHHSKPWHCTFKGCEFEKGGFLSRKMRDDHLERFHLQKQSPMPDMTKEADKDVLQQLVYELVKSDDVEGVNSLPITSMGMRTNNLMELLECAAQHASSKMLRALVAAGKERGWHRFYGTVDTAIRYKALLLRTFAGDNLDTFQQLLKLDKEDWGEKSGFVEGGMRHGCLRVVDLLNDKMLDRLCAFLEQDTLELKNTYMPSQLMISSFRQEQILLRLWEQVPKHVWLNGTWKHAIVNVASTTCSTKLAGYLLGRGVSVDAQSKRTSPTALHHAIRKNTQESAEFARFLLRNGADPEITQEIKRHEGTRKTGKKTIHETRRIRDEKGAKEISKWLGITWDELLEETKSARQKPSESEPTPGGPSDSTE